jgi:hypothetical protein
MEPLEPYLWKYRIVAYTLEDSDTELFHKTLIEYEAKSEERDIRFIALDAKPVPTQQNHLNLSAKQLNTLRSELDLSIQQTTLVLIGKDGGVKFRIHNVDLPEIFRLIDQMPMRRAEMRNIN